MAVEMSRTQLCNFFDNIIDPLVGDQAGIDFNQSMRRCAEKAQAFVRADLKANAPAVVVFQRRSDDRTQLEAIEFADPAQGIVDALLLRLKLRFVR